MSESTPPKKQQSGSGNGESRSQARAQEPEERQEQEEPQEPTLGHEEFAVTSDQRVQMAGLLVEHKKYNRAKLTSQEWEQALREYLDTPRP